MILGIGVDIVEVERFKSWRNFSYPQLLKMFSEDELTQCISNGFYAPEKLAVRFAAKEAFFKALSMALIKLDVTQKEFSLLFLCPQVQICKGLWDVPFLDINWLAIEKKIGKNLPFIKSELSLSHERTSAIAYVMLWRA